MIGAGDVDLAGNRHRPGKPLIDAEQNIGRDDPIPGRAVEDHKGDGNGGKPAPEQHLAPPDPLRKAPGDKIYRAFDKAKANDEGHQQSERTRRHAEFLFGQHRHNIALQTDGQATKKTCKSCWLNWPRFSRMP
jgi:hypothetical protein